MRGKIIQIAAASSENGESLYCLTDEGVIYERCYINLRRNDPKDGDPVFGHRWIERPAEVWP